MNQLFDETAKVYSGNTITIGIQDPKNIQIEECEGGGIFAFVVGNRLFSYDIANNKMALLFSFYNQKNFDARTLYMEHKIKILNVDETGNVQFAVYGYMNRGRHEGSTGVQINMYNSTENTIEEQVYIPYTGSPDMLEKSLDKLIYADSRENLYLLLDSVVYQINLNAHSYKTVVSNLQENSYQVSKSGKMIAWSTGKSTDSSTKLMTMNLATGQQSSIDAQQGEFIKPLGFIGDDLIYGLAQQKDVKTDTNGHVSFLMYAVKIQDENGKVLKDYKENGMYITGCSVTNNQITVSRAQWNSSTNSLQTADSDQIMNSEAEEIGKNTISTAVSNSYETIAQLIVKNQMNTNSIRLLTPKEVLFEGENEVELKKKDNSVSRYFVYNLYGLDEIYTDPASAVNEAFNTSGAVVNDSGNYVWYKGNLQAKNQIMKIKGGVQKTDTKTAMAVCLDTILEFENVSRNSQYMLDSGKNVMEILQENISNIQALDLTGCKLDAILYYVNQDIPVLVTLGNGQAELLIGFNDTELVIMDPSDGTVHKINRKDAETQFEAAGSSYLSYIRTEE